MANSSRLCLHFPGDNQRSRAVKGEASLSKHFALLYILIPHCLLQITDTDSESSVEGTFKGRRVSSGIRLTCTPCKHHSIQVRIISSSDEEDFRPVKGKGKGKAKGKTPLKRRTLRKVVTGALCIQIIHIHFPIRDEWRHSPL